MSARTIRAMAERMNSTNEGTRVAAPIRVCVQHHPRGHWEVLVLGSKGRISCETLEDARRIAYLSVAHAQDCELVVRDAYNRVLQRELIDGHRSGPTERGLVPRSRRAQKAPNAS